MEADGVNLREEPYAGKSQVRICEDESEWLSYSTTVGRMIVTAVNLRTFGESAYKRIAFTPR
jgi:hypothetical protein